MMVHNCRTWLMCRTLTLTLNVTLHSDIASLLWSMLLIWLHWLELSKHKRDLMQDVYTDIYLHSERIVSFLFALLFGRILVNKSVISCREFAVIFAHFYKMLLWILNFFAVNFYYPYTSLNLKTLRLPDLSRPTCTARRDWRGQVRRIKLEYECMAYAPLLSRYNGE